MLPSVIFSILYFSLFYNYESFGNLVYSIINGCGHMWFLPMLFWCFIGGWLIEQIKISDGWKLLFLVCLNIFWPKYLPLRLSRATTYLFYFYGGYLLYKHCNCIKAGITTKHIIWSWILFIIVFVVLRPIKEAITIGDQVSKINRLITMSSRNACQLVYASWGTMAFYITSVWYTLRHKLLPFTTKLASCCFGIYLFQEFILKSLYYKTSFAIVVGPYWLPWLGFVIAALLSYILSIILLNTKAGRYLIG